MATRTKDLLKSLSNQIGWVGAGVVLFGVVLVALVIPILILTAIHPHDELEHKGKCESKDNPCASGIWSHEAKKCIPAFEPEGHSCDSPCFAPENSSVSGRDTHWCEYSNFDGYTPCHMCVGSQCLGTCEVDSDCPDLMNTTVNFLNTTNIADLYEFGFNKSCVQPFGTCLYRYDVAVIPGLNNSVHVCSDAHFFHDQCMGILNPSETFRPCLKTTSLCRSAAEPADFLRSGSTIEDVLRVATADQDNNFVVDTCLFHFACSVLPGLEQFNVFPAGFP